MRLRLISSCAGALAFLLLAATPAWAQLRGKVTVGLGVTSIRPRAAALTTRARVRPSLGRIPARGPGLALALNWFEANAGGDIIGVGADLGTLTIRPLMAGVSYTWLEGRLGLSPSLVTGPALNTLNLDDDAPGMPAVRAERTTSVSLVVRPGLNVTYAITPRIGFTAFTGYLANHPTFRLRIDDVERRVRWNASGIVLSAGAVVALF